MDIPLPADPADAEAAARDDHRRIRRAAMIAGSFVALLWWIKGFELYFETSLRAFGVRPWDPSGLVGVLTGTLLHGSVGHLLANTLPLLVLIGLAAATVPRALARAVPLIWIGSGVFVWFTGNLGSTHLGASGLTHGLMFFLFLLGLLRRDRPAVASALLVFFLYGGMLMTVFPREVGISWQYHLGGALFGLLSALLWRAQDPAPARKRYSWEDEELRPDADDDELEPPRPTSVPVLWQRTTDDRPQGGVVLSFPPRNTPVDDPESSQKP